MQTSIRVVTTQIVVLCESLGLETQALIFCGTWQMHLLLFYIISISFIFNDVALFLDRKLTKFQKKCIYWTTKIISINIIGLRSKNVCHKIKENTIESQITWLIWTKFLLYSLTWFSEIKPGNARAHKSCICCWYQTC